MKPEICSFCHGILKKGKTEFTAKAGKSIITIKNVPAFVCNNCGEAYFEVKISKKIDKVMVDFHKGKFLSHPVAAGEIEFDRVA